MRTARPGRALRCIGVVAVLGMTPVSLQATAAAQDDQGITTSTTIGVEIGDGISVTRPPATEPPEVAGKQVSAPDDGMAWWPWAVGGGAVALAVAIALRRRLGWRST